MKRALLTASELIRKFQTQHWGKFHNALSRKDQEILDRFFESRQILCAGLSSHAGHYANDDGFRAHRITEGRYGTNRNSGRKTEGSAQRLDCKSNPKEGGQ